MDIAPEDFVVPASPEGVRVMAISSVAGKGMKELKDELWREVSLCERQAEMEDGE
jgi:GTP-binding protein